MQYIKTPEQLVVAAKKMAEYEVLAIDLECENNLHHYGTYISLIQVSSKDDDWIVDVLALEKIDPLLHVLDQKKIIKIFHDVSFDLRILHLQFDCRPTNIFDTQLGALLLGKKEIGLGSLLAEYYDIEKDGKHQMADWTKRPLSKEMLSYATKDTKYLLPLYHDIVKELKEQDRLMWAQEECRHLEQSEMLYKENMFSDFKGFKFLSKKHQAILKNLFELREELAEKVNKPNYFILSNSRIKELLDKPPSSVKECKNIKGVHPVVKRNAQRLFDAITIYDTSTLPEIKRHPRYTPEQKKETFELGLLAEGIAKKLHLRKHLILNKDQIQDIVLNKRYDSLRSWQKELLGF